MPSVLKPLTRAAFSRSEIESVSADLFSQFVRNGCKNELAALDRLISDVDVEPRAYQRRIISTALKMYAGEWLARDGSELPVANSVLVESPTGSGKTVMGLAIARLMQQLTGCRVGWVAMRRNLLTQAAAENVRRRFGLEMQPISMFEKNPPDVELLVIDEAQHDAATSMANLHSAIQPRWTLGLSATPYRADRIKLCFDQVIQDIGIGQLIADGFLSPYHHYTIPEYSPQSVADLLTGDSEKWGRSLVFFHRREQCYELHRLLEQAGISSDVVTAATNRERQLDAFDAGETQVLINMAILTEGFDCPELKTVFCRPSGKGCTIQMAGRVLRKSSCLPAKQVVQCRKTRHPMLKTAMAQEQYIWSRDGWRSITVNKQLDAITRNSRAIIAQTPVELPKLVSANRPRAQRWRSRRDRNTEGI